MRQQIESVNRILDDLELSTKPKLLVFNKTDTLEPEMAQNICTLHQAFGVTALVRSSLRPVMEAIEAAIWQRDPRSTLH